VLGTCPGLGPPGWQRQAGSSRLFGVRRTEPPLWQRAAAAARRGWFRTAVGTRDGWCDGSRTPARARGQSRRAHNQSRL